jgi:hypothetical protein
MFNVGLAEDGYTEEVVINDGKQSVKSTTGRWTPLVAACGESVFSMDENGGEVAEGVQTTVTLNWLVQDGVVHEGVIAEHPSLFTGTSFTSRGAPCVDGEVFFLATAYISAQVDSPGRMSPAQVEVEFGDLAARCPLYTNSPSTDLRSCPTIERWNTRTGEHQTIPVLDQTGLELNLAIDAFDWSLYDSGSVIDGQFYWWHSDGHLLVTDLASGATKLIASDPDTDGKGEEISYYLQVGKRTAHVLSIPPNDAAAGKDVARLLAFNLDDGELIEEVAIPGLAKSLSVDLAARGFAVNPTRLG